MSKNEKGPRLANGDPKNVDNPGRTIETYHSRLIKEYQGRGYSIGLTAGEAGGEDEARERTSQRFLLHRVLIADKDITKAELKVGGYLLMHKYNDHTGQCNPGNDAIAEATALDLRTVLRAKAALKIAMYLVYESTEGGYKSDTTNDYEFRFPPLVGAPRVRPAPKTTPGRIDTTPGTLTKGTPGKIDTRPLVGAPPKQEVEQALEHQDNSVPLPSVADTLPCQGASKVQEGKEGSKWTSEGETVASPLPPLKVLTREERKEQKLGPELSVIVRRSQVDYREKDGKLYIATSSVDDAKAIQGNEETVIDALRPDFPFACGVHAWVADGGRA